MKKIRKGVVVSDRMDKTVVVRVERVFQHPVFKKIVKKYSRFKAHDKDNKCKVGDQVEIIETKPISKDKRWKVTNILGFEKVKTRIRPGRLHKKVEEVKEELKEEGTGRDLSVQEPVQEGENK